MGNQEIIRAWKDEEYFENLSAGERAALPDNPAGLIDLSDLEMETVAGGGTWCVDSTGCCPFLTTTCPSIADTTPCGYYSYTCGCSAISELVVEDAEWEEAEC